MKIDFSSRRNLELTETMRNRERRGTLLWVLDKTKTAMGKRLVRNWIEQPLVNLAKITKRHNAVGELFDDSVLLENEIAAISNVSDMERLMARIVYETANAKELRSLLAAIRLLPDIKSGISECKSALLGETCRSVDLLTDVAELIDKAIQ